MVEEVHTGSAIALYPRIVGASWNDLAEPVRLFHAKANPTRYVGRFIIRRGEGLLARMLAGLLRLPAAGEQVPTQLVVTQNDSGELWKRIFAGKPFLTKLRAHDEGFLAEYIGLIEILYRLKISAQALCYVQTKVSLRVGAMRIPLPRWLSPNISGREWAASNEKGVHVSVSVSVPFAGSLINYQGYIVRED